MEMQKTQNIQHNVERKEKVRGLTLPNIKATVAPNIKL